MKKLLMVAAFSAICAAQSFAQISFGVRGNFGASFFSITEDEEHKLGKEWASLVAEIFQDSTGDTVNPSYEVSNKSQGTGGFSLWANYALPNVASGLGVQAELGFLFNNGTKISATSKATASGVTVKMDADIEMSYTTLELPLLVTYTFNKGGRFEITPCAGFYLSFPLGKMKMDMSASGEVSASGGYKQEVPEESQSEEYKIDTACLVGTAFGVDFAVNFGEHIAGTFGGRYMIDFNKLKVDGDEVARRNALMFSAGLRYRM